MRIILLFIIALSVSTTCVKKNECEFSLQGKTVGLSNGTVLYLTAKESDKIIDSVVVENNSFSLATDITSYPLNVILKNNDNSLYKSFWLDNARMEFNASENDFANAVIIGSYTQTLYPNLYESIDTLSRKDQEKVLIDFIKTNTDHILGAVVLSECYILWKKEKTEPLYLKLSNQNKKSIYGEKILRYINLNKNPKIGDSLIDFELTNQYGRTTKLSELKGKLILLEFWASWCAPCRTDNKKLRVIYHKFNPLGFEIFQVSLDDNKKKWSSAIEQDKLDWTNVSDLRGWNNEAAIIYGVSLLPSNFLISSDGIIIGQNLREENLEQKLEELLLADPIEKKKSSK